MPFCREESGEQGKGTKDERDPDGAVSVVAGGSSETCQLWTYFGSRACGTCWLASRGCGSRREGLRIMQRCLLHTTRKIKLPFTGTRRATKAANLGEKSRERGLGYVQLGDSSVIQFRGAGLAVGSKGLASKGEACAPRLM